MKLPETYRESEQYHEDSDDEYLLNDISVIIKTNGETPLVRDLDRKTTLEIPACTTRIKSGTSLKQPDRFDKTKHLRGNEKTASFATSSITALTQSQSMDIETTALKPFQPLPLISNLSSPHNSNLVNV